MENHTCPKCGGQMDSGRVPKGTVVSVGYKSASQSRFSVPLIAERAMACLECGFLEFYLDPAKLKAKRS